MVIDQLIESCHYHTPVAVLIVIVVTTVVVIVVVYAIVDLAMVAVGFSIYVI